jgi:hypothetical protein
LTSYGKTTFVIPANGLDKPSYTIDTNGIGVGFINNGIDSSDSLQAVITRNGSRNYILSFPSGQISYRNMNVARGAATSRSVDLKLHTAASLAAIGEENIGLEQCNVFLFMDIFFP